RCSSSPAVLEVNICAFVPSGRGERLLKCIKLCLWDGVVFFKTADQNPNSAGALSLLSTRRERPRGYRAAKQRDELAPLHAGHGDFLPCRMPSAPPAPTTLGLLHAQVAAERAANPWARPESF